MYPDVLIGLALVLFGGFVLSRGILFWTGKDKGLYFRRDVPVFAPRRYIYLAIPGGLEIILIGIGTAIGLNTSLGSVLFEVVGQLFLVTCLVVLVFQPRWLKPYWVRQLEDKYGDILDILIAETRRERKLRGEEWFKWACSDEGLEEWVAEVRRRYRLGRMRSWFHTLDRRYPHLDFETLVKVLGEAAGQEDATWAQRMQTEEDLTRWAEEVLRKRGLLKE